MKYVIFHKYLNGQEGPFEIAKGIHKEGVFNSFEEAEQTIEQSNIEELFDGCQTYRQSNSTWIDDDGYTIWIEEFDDQVVNKIPEISPVMALQ